MYSSCKLCNGYAGGQEICDKCHKEGRTSPFKIIDDYEGLLERKQEWVRQSIYGNKHEKVYALAELENLKHVLERIPALEKVDPMTPIGARTKPSACNGG